LTGGLALGDAIPEAIFLTFVLRDKQWAKTELDLRLKRIKEQSGGKKPLAGFYFNCAGRGMDLYGEENHDVNLIRRHLGSFPLMGLFSSFELAPQGDHLAVHGFAGVLALLYS
jgi:small ligand-binding sensory domain FIST